MRYTIYQITNNLNGKIYIGKHQTKNPNDGYFGSGKAIVNAIKLHGKENFTKEILFDFDTEDEMNAKERELITEEFVSRSDTYNLGIGGEGGAHFKGKHHSDETKERIKNTLNSDSNKQKQIETSRKVGLASKGRKLSEQARRNISNGAKKRLAGGNHQLMADEIKKKISDSLKKYYKENSEYIKSRPKKKRKRKPLSEETKEKLRQIQLKRWNKTKQI